MRLAPQGRCVPPIPDDCTMYFPGWSDLKLNASTKARMVVTWKATSAAWRSVHVTIDKDGAGFHTPRKDGVVDFGEGTGESPLAFDVEIPAGDYHVTLFPGGAAEGPSEQSVNWTLLPR